MSSEIKTVFRKQLLAISLANLVPSRPMRDKDFTSVKYRTILASIPTMGLIEPLAVFPCRDKPTHFVLLDGHLRLKALKELGHETAQCMLATEEDPFTYNDKISRLSTIQEQRMIEKALKNGVSQEQIAQTLGIDVKRFRRRINLLTGIHPEVVDRLKDKPIAPRVFGLIRKVKPARQLEFASLMVAMNDYSRAYVSALLLATRSDLLEQPDKMKSKKLSPEEVSQIEREMSNLEKDFRLYQDSYGENALTLNVAQRYVQRLLGNVSIHKFVSKHYPEVLEEMSAIAALESL